MAAGSSSSSSSNRRRKTRCLAPISARHWLICCGLWTAGLSTTQIRLCGPFSC
uniref:Uncharacterized protein n=1 Tax=Macrostomum lignano TaxID=282301 RepID=A0A1I8F8Q9_9PLAT